MRNSFLHEGKTIAHIAAEHGAVEVLHYLETEGLLTSDRDNKGKIQLFKHSTD